MSGWDEGQLFYSDPITEDTNGDNERAVAVKSFTDFLLQYRQDNVFVYRFGCLNGFERACSL